MTDFLDYVGGLKEEKKIVRRSTDARAMRYASGKLKNDPEVVMAAVSVVRMG